MEGGQRSEVIFKNGVFHAWDGKAWTEIDVDPVYLTKATPVNAVAAAGTLTLNGGVVIDGETVTIGDDTYEFAADAAQTVAAGNIAVDITTYTTASSIPMSMATQPTAGDTITIGVGDGEKVYTFVTDGTDNAEGEVTIGTDAATAQVALVAAINGTDDHNTAHTQVSAGDFASNDCTITALVGGVAGDLIATTETFTAEGNVIAAELLTSGADCTAANADGALIAADAGVAYAMTQGAGTTVTVTAAIKGTAANVIATTTTMANAAFGATKLAGGVNGTIGVDGATHRDASYLYIAVDDNTVVDANWRRVALGSAY